MQAYALRLEDREAPLGPLPDVVRKQRARRHDRPDSIHPALYPHRKKPFAGTNSIPWIFAAKTTASGLIALLVAFTFNLDQPYWALLTVFIVSQPLQSRQVLAKSLYRIIGTVIGAAVALLFVALFAQERVLFLGALALWIGVCAFGSQYARNFAAYSFVLSGYTVAIVGIPGALDAGNAFYIATGRVTEVCLGIIVAATVNPSAAAIARRRVRNCWARRSPSRIYGLRRYSRIARSATAATSCDFWTRLWSTPSALRNPSASSSTLWSDARPTKRGSTMPLPTRRLRSGHGAPPQWARTP